MAFTQWMPISNRGGGSWYTNDFAVPGGIDWVNIRFDVDPLDFATPDRSVVATIEYSDDGGSHWRPDLTVSWVGSPPPGKTGEWIVGCSGISFFVGYLVRVHFVTTGSFRWGLSGEII